MKTKPAIQTHQLDAKDQILGRLATRVADLLRGKGKPSFVPYLNVGDRVIVTNASQIRLTGRKMTDKKYIRHSGYPGGLKEETAAEIFNRQTEEVLRRAIYGMLPKNRLRSAWMKQLIIYPGDANEKKA